MPVLLWGLTRRRTLDAELEAFIVTTFVLETVNQIHPQLIQMRCFPRRQGSDTAMGHLEIELSQSPGAGWDTGFKPLLKGPHVQQAQGYYGGGCSHLIQQPLKFLEGK